LKRISLNRIYTALALVLTLILLSRIFSIISPSSAAERRTPAAHSSAFVSIENGHFQLNGNPYTYLGANLWAAMNLGSAGIAGDRARLTRELDRLQVLGITNIRILAASEGPDTEPGRIVPSLQSAPGNFNSDLLAGLDFALSEMGKRQMRAVMVLNNFWAWSGGMAQYVSWSEGSAIPYPPPFSSASWNDFEAYSSTFYSDAKAVALSMATMQKIIMRTNSISGLAYVDDPTIMSWELGNEPRGMNNVSAFNAWIAATAHAIKTLDPNHLVTIGTEGTQADSGIDIAQNNTSVDVDYATTHIWPQNFGWYDPTNAVNTYPVAVADMKNYLAVQISGAQVVHKPLVLEEFGFSRDGNSLDPNSATAYRDQFYEAILGEALSYAQSNQSVSGVNFWAWSGEGVPPVPARANGLWQIGDPFLGDPPHEQQGWYSVYASDLTTTAIIARYAKLFSDIH
jgi:mannan endo-1,4-beta-mannosidase